MKANLIRRCGSFRLSCCFGLFCCLSSAGAALAVGDSDAPPLDVPVTVHFAEQKVEGRIKSLSSDWVVLMTTEGGKTYWINTKSIVFIEKAASVSTGALEDALGRQARDFAASLTRRHFTPGENGIAFSCLRTTALLGDPLHAPDLYVQYQGFSTEVVEEAVSPSESLNGVEWKGRLKIRAKTERSLRSEETIGQDNANPSWNQWSDVPKENVFSLPLTKQKGKEWETDNSKDLYVAPTASELKMLPK